MKKIRLDLLLVEQGFAQSRERAKTEIMSGNVFVNGQRMDKPGTEVADDSNIELRGNKLRYVSRGGLKLEKALSCFPVQPEGKVCIDCGASTGGFTDCLLQNGAVRVYAVDVGYGQLAWSIRNDERVVVMERTNVRYLTPEQFDEKMDIAVIDVSFISLSLILPAVRQLLKNDGHVVCLIKPQFEAGKDKIGKKGVVRDEKTHVEVIEKIMLTAVNADFCVKGLDYSPIKGPEGNIEYLCYLAAGQGENIDADVQSLVRRAHEELDRGTV